MFHPKSDQVPDECRARTLAHPQNTGDQSAHVSRRRLLLQGVAFAASSIAGSTALGAPQKRGKKATTQPVPVARGQKEDLLPEGPLHPIATPRGKPLLPTWSEPTIAEAGDDFDWEAHLRDPNNPKYGNRLPSYELASPYEVYQDARRLWQRMLGSTPGVDPFPRIRYEDPKSTWQRISAPVVALIGQKNQERTAQNLPPITIAHEHVLKFCAVHFWTLLHVSYGNANTDPGVRAALDVAAMNGIPGTGPKANFLRPVGALAVAQAMANAPNYVGTCGHFANVGIALSHHAGLWVDHWDCTVGGVPHAGVSLGVHSVGLRRYGYSMDVFDRKLKLGPRSLAPALILSDSTFAAMGGLWKDIQRSEFPNKDYTLVNAFGDSTPFLGRWFQGHPTDGLDPGKLGWLRTGGKSLDVKH